MSNRTPLWEKFQLISFSDVAWVVALFVHTMTITDEPNLTVERRIFLIFIAIAVMRGVFTSLGNDHETKKTSSYPSWQTGLLLMSLIIPWFLIMLLAYLPMPNLHPDLGIMTLVLGALGVFFLVMTIIDSALPLFFETFRQRPRPPADMSCRFWALLGVNMLISVTTGWFALGIMVLLPEVIDDLLAIGRLYFNLLVIYFAIRLLIGFGNDDDDKDEEQSQLLENQQEGAVVTQTSEIVG